MTPERLTYGTRHPDAWGHNPNSPNETQAKHHGGKVFNR